MFERITTDTDDRGQVGIGTLIVFIAMVLVAAIAAGVLINTAGFLQSSAEQSGQQAAEQVTNRLVEVSTVGEVNGSQIVEANMTVRLAPGSADVNLNDTTMQWITASGSTQLVSDQVSGTSFATFNWTTLRDNDGSITDDNTLNDPVDRAIITIDLSQAELNYLDSGNTVTLQVNTRSGGQTTVTLNVPDSLSGKESVEL
ncbi:archaellin/type IV pilin N-terminal domain-containing protein [Halococcoides cellulosivorans]|uniref:Flagellin n=1 Tax=Halococcoides cellulosivorans TaxID=1679096 RepID=A0A2R4X147_9EURY|nr:archaellin/type IV pilin N-terminal domain-containing protein [Halococcoides cellulosivorans]AWB27520.1 flagellin [Halococcoides cellulosivorans]